MTIAVIVLVLFALFLLYLFTLRGRREPERFKAFQGVPIAHRGFHQKPTVPENSMAAFRSAVERGYGIELDVHLLKDGGLAVFHDHTLNRTTGQTGTVEDLTEEELKEQGNFYDECFGL